MILVTGGTGLVGSHLLVELLRRGSQIRATYREGNDLSRLRHLLLSQYPDVTDRWNTIEWVRAPLSDIPALDEAVRGVETIYHCAGLIDFDPRQASALMKTNWEGTRDLVNAALSSEVKSFCYTSSIATIGGLGTLVSESDMWDPNRTNDYATSKHLGEMEVWRGGQEGLQIVIVNPGVILGPGNWDRGSGRLFSAVADGLRYSIPGGTGFVGVWDVVRCMMELTDKGLVGRRYLLVAENLTYLEIFRTIAEAMNLKPPGRSLKPWQLEILWRLDWLGSRFSGRPRKLSRDMARGLRERKEYDNSRILETLNMEFEPIGEVVQRCAAFYAQSQA